MIRSQIVLLGLAYLLINLSCYKKDDYHASNYLSRFKLVVTNNGCLADSSESVKVSLVASDFEAIDGVNVDFYFQGTSSQKLSSSFLNRNSNGKSITSAEVYYKSIYPESIQVTANLKFQGTQFALDTAINLVNAPPTGLELSSGAQSINWGNTANALTLSTRPYRDKGRPSVGNTIHLKSIGDDGKAYGFFSDYETRLGSQSTISNKFLMGSDTFTGIIQIIAYTEDSIVKPDLIKIHSKR